MLVTAPAGRLSPRHLCIASCPLGSARDSTRRRLRPKSPSPACSLPETVAIPEECRRTIEEECDKNEPLSAVALPWRGESLPFSHGCRRRVGRAGRGARSDCELFGAVPRRLRGAGRPARRNDPCFETGRRECHRGFYQSPAAIQIHPRNVSAQEESFGAFRQYDPRDETETDTASCLARTEETVQFAVLPSVAQSSARHCLCTIGCTLPTGQACCPIRPSSKLDIRTSLALT